MAGQSSHLTSRAGVGAKKETRGMAKPLPRYCRFSLRVVVDAALRSVAEHGLRGVGLSIVRIVCNVGSPRADVAPIFGHFSGCSTSRSAGSESVTDSPYSWPSTMVQPRRHPSRPSAG